MSIANLKTRHIACVAIALALCGANPAARASDKTEAAELVAQSRDTLRSLVNDRDFVSMKSALAQAKGVLIFPQVVKAGFILGGAGGTGVLLAREGGSSTWAGPAFYTMGSASLGLQAGAVSAEMVMLVNSQKALDSLRKNKVKLGADASVALGSMGVDKDKVLNTDFVVYSKVKGAFAGVAVDGSVLDVRESLNAAYYGKPATPDDIVFKRSVSNPDAVVLQNAVADAAK